MPKDRQITVSAEVNETTIKMLQNAVAALGDIYYALYLNCEVPAKFDSFKSKSTVELKEEFNELAKFFNTIKNDWEAHK